MRLSEILLEYNFSKTVKTYSEKLLQRVTNEAEKNMFTQSVLNDYPTGEDLIKWIESNDPTQNKKFTEWMIRTYIKGGINLLEDMSRASENLEYFNRLARSGHLQGQQKNIDSYKSLNDLEDLIEEFYVDNTSTAELQDQGKQLIQSENAKIVHNGPKYRILMPLTEKASCYFGSGTRWCISGKKNNPFNWYMKTDHFYFVTVKSGNKRYAISFGNKAYFDAKDNKIDRLVLLKQYPDLMNKLFSIEGWENVKKKDPVWIIIYEGNTPEKQMELVKKDIFYLRYIPNPTKEVQEYVYNKNGMLHPYPDTELLRRAIISSDSHHNLAPIVGRLAPDYQVPEEIQKLIFKKDSTSALRYLKNPSKDLVEKYVTRLPELVMSGIKTDYMLEKFDVNYYDFSMKDGSSKPRVQGYGKEFSSTKDLVNWTKEQSKYSHIQYKLSEFDKKLWKVTKDISLEKIIGLYVYNDTLRESTEACYLEGKINGKSFNAFIISGSNIFKIVYDNKTLGLNAFVKYLKGK